MAILIRWIWLGLLMPMLLYGERYEPVLLKTEAKLLPRVLLMTEGVSYEAPNRFTICIVREPGDTAAAAAFRNALLAYYSRGWQYHSMQIVEGSYEAVEEVCAQSEALFLLDSDERNIRRAVAFATANRRLTASYERRYLRYGVLLSLHVGRNVRPYLNIDQAAKGGISFDADLLQMSKRMEPAGTER